MVSDVATVAKTVDEVLVTTDFRGYRSFERPRFLANLTTRAVDQRECRKNWKPRLAWISYARLPVQLEPEPAVHPKQ